MSFAQHGKIGGNIYLLMLVIAVVAPVTRIFSAHGVGYFILGVGLVAICAWINCRSIIHSGGNSKGELLGLISGLLVWLGAWGASKIWLVARGNPAFKDLVLIISVATVSILCSFMFRLGKIPSNR